MFLNFISLRDIPIVSMNNTNDAVHITYRMFDFNAELSETLLHCIMEH